MTTAERKFVFRQQGDLDVDDGDVVSLADHRDCLYGFYLWRQEWSQKCGFSLGRYFKRKTGATERRAFNQAVKRWEHHFGVVPTNLVFVVPRVWTVYTWCAIFPNRRTLTEALREIEIEEILED